MTKSRIVAWLALAVCMQVSAEVSAQDMSFDLEETEKSDGKSAPKKSDDPGEGGEGNVIGDLANEEDKTPDSAAPTGPKPTEVSEEIYAVQQVYALRNNRLEILPSFGFTLNDPFVSHPNLGVGLNYWITNVLAVGANLNWYQGLESESELNFHVRRSARLGTRPTEFQFGASLNMTYVPVYGKFSMFRRYIFQWDAYLMGGIGIMRTRPVPVVDPQIRSFDYTYKLSILNPALGLRVFLSKWLTVFAEMRVYPYLEKLENLRVGLGDAARNDKDRWLDDSSTLVFNVVTSIGMSIYFPFTFDYKLPK
ncbi:MAG: outer membrane beta-barrel domain-containing protein [Polyangiales bacterium]